ncbi:MAG TPA: hypothetical protein VGB17_16255 [Pyrinomonadaceae bacterium]|jgi:hypothetical protein
MKSPSSYNWSRAFGLLLLPALVLCVVSSSRAQDKNPLAAPPPMRLIPREDRTQLESVNDIKNRTRLSLELAERHLARAEGLTASQEFDKAAVELGVYQAIIEDAMRYLIELNSDKGKVRDLFKRIELALRSHGPRIEAMRRMTPAEYAVHLKDTLEFTRDARSKALNSFYGTTVIRDQPAAATDNDKASVRKQHDTPQSKQQDKQP